MNDPKRFDPASVGNFRVTDRSFDEESGTVSLGYALGDDHRFVETVTFETPAVAGDGTRGPPGLERALLHLHIAAGTSYYKAAAPPVVSVEHARLAPAEVDFHHHLYDEGLREFAVTNGLPVPRPVAIAAGRVTCRPTPSPAPPSPPERPGGIVVPIGGGKDSMVLIEALKRSTPPAVRRQSPSPGDRPGRSRPASSCWSSVGGSRRTWASSTGRGL